MKKYKAGDKIVLEITGINELGSYIFGDITYSWLVSSGFFDKFSKPLSDYTENLEKKNQNKQKRIEKLVERLHRQAAEITQLLAENAELKEQLNQTAGFYREQVRIAKTNGQQEAWELAHRICKPRVVSDIKDMFHCFGIDEFCQLFDKPYSEIAEKFAEWERQKEEICVGDEVELINGVKFFVTHYCDGYANGIESSGRCFYVFLGQDGKKTGRHIDIAAMLAQIGGEE